MADCGYFEELITAELDGQLSPEEEAALHAHLETCENCRRFAAAMRSLSGAAARDLPPVPEGFSQAVMAEIRSAAPEKKKVIRFPARALALAAAAAVVLWAGVRLAGPDRVKGMGSAAPAAASVVADSAPMEEASQAAEPEAPMMAMSESRAAGDTGIVTGSANSQAQFAAAAPAAAEEADSAEAPVPEITVRGEEILFDGESLSLEELEEALLRDWDGQTPVKLTDDHAVKAAWDAVNALLSRLDIPTE